MGLSRCAIIALLLATPTLSLPSQLIFEPAAVIPAIASLSLSSPDHSRLAAHIASFPEIRLVRLAEGAEAVRITEGEKALLVHEGIRFVDVTDDVEGMTVQATQTYPSELKYDTSSLQPSFDHISVQEMTTFLTKFSSFHTRYYQSQTGRESQLWLLGHLKELVANLNPEAKVTFTEFQHKWVQRSVIVRFEPEEGASEDVVILGAHQDSVNQLPWGAAPGADDDGSGTTTLVSIFTALLAQSYVPTTHALEFHFYSAEEGGLLGSGEVSRAYASEGKVVRAMMHMDVTAYIKSGTKPVVGIINDNVDQGLVVFMRQIVTEYAEIDYADTKCGYGCSDFASWTKVGAPASCIAEGKFEDTNPNLHSGRDLLTNPDFSFEHIAQFARVGLGLVWELAGGQ